MPEKPSAKILRCWPAMRKIGMFLKIERCEMPAIRTLAAVWPAMRAPAMPNGERCGSSDASQKTTGPNNSNLRQKSSLKRVLRKQGTAPSPALPAPRISAALFRALPSHFFWAVPVSSACSRLAGRKVGYGDCAPGSLEEGKSGCAYYGDRPTPRNRRFS